MRAMILAAGFGTRLWPLTIGRTKPAIPFLNRPLIACTIEYLRRFGIQDLIINLHHEPESVRAQIGDGSEYGVRISYSIEEPEILGTSGALDRVRHLLEGDVFVAINGKIITDMDLTAAIESHRKRRAMATLVLRPNPAHERFSEVEITPSGRIHRFAGFPDPRAAGTRSAPLMFTGIHILSPEIFRYIPRGVFSDFVRDVYPAAMQAGEAIDGYAAEGEWYELSTLERYLSVSLAFLAREGRTFIADAGCRIDPDARVVRSVLWKRVRVERGAEIEECLIGDDVRIGAGERYARAVIVRAEAASGSVRPEKAQAGEVRGENLVVPI
ncbi:MAG: NDP-sugar synthase [Acidobacteria bacterium]|nr:NDP-sugar synthase [Acidobacteriota bacterium]